MLKYIVFWVISSCFVLLAGDGVLKDEKVELRKKDSILLNERPSDATTKEDVDSDSDKSLGVSPPKSVSRTSSEDSDEEMHQSTALPTREEIQSYVQQNNIPALIEKYHAARGRADFNPELFYPEDYILNHIRYSFSQFNKAAILSILISAVRGHQLSKDIIINGTLAMPRNAELQTRLEYKEKDAAPDFAYILSVPFSFNNPQIREKFKSGPGLLFLNNVIANKQDYESIVLYNTAYIIMDIRHNFDAAYVLFKTAGDKGVLAGYIEAAKIILKSNGMPIEGQQYREGTVETSQKIKELLDQAGIEGQWELATCYRYGAIVNPEGINFYNRYFKVIESGCTELAYFYEMGELHTNMAQQRKDATKKKRIELYETSLAFFVHAVKAGDYSLYSRITEAAEKLLELVKDTVDEERITRAKEEIKEEIKQSRANLALFKQAEEELVDQLLS